MLSPCDGDDDEAAVTIQPKTWPAVAVLAAALAAGGCDGRGPFRGGGRPQPGRGRVGASDPTEDQYTILLQALAGSGHVRNAKHIQKVLTERLRWKGVFVIHQAGHSQVYLGRYASIPAARKDLRTARRHRAANGVRPFAQALVVTLPGADVGPAEWNLKNVDAAYTLLVAEFKNDPERKYRQRRKQALHACRRLRERGREAYFLHGKVTSRVTIGAFGHGAVRVRRTARGASIKIVDPRVLKLRREFSELLLNGNTVTDITRDRRGRVIMRDTLQTYLIRCPKNRLGDGP